MKKRRRRPLNLEDSPQPEPAVQFVANIISRRQNCRQNQTPNQRYVSCRASAGYITRSNVHSLESCSNRKPVRNSSRDSNGGPPASISEADLILKRRDSDSRRTQSINQSIETPPPQFAEVCDTSEPFTLISNKGDHRQRSTTLILNKNCAALDRINSSFNDALNEYNDFNLHSRAGDGLRVNKFPADDYAYKDYAYKDYAYKDGRQIIGCNRVACECENNFAVNLDKSSSGGFSRRMHLGGDSCRRWILWNGNSNPAIENNAKISSGEGASNFNVFDNAYFETKDNPGYNSSDESLDEILGKIGELKNSPDNLSLSPSRIPEGKMERRLEVISPSSGFISSGELSLSTGAVSPCPPFHSVSPNQSNYISPTNQFSTNFVNNQPVESDRPSDHGSSQNVHISTVAINVSNVSKTELKSLYNKEGAASAKSDRDMDDIKYNRTEYTNTRGDEPICSREKAQFCGPRRLLKHLSSSKRSDDHVRQTISVKHFQDGVVERTDSTTRSKSSLENDSSLAAAEETISESVKFYLVDGKVRIVDKVECQKLFPVNAITRSSFLSRDRFQPPDTIAGEKVLLKKLVVEIRKCTEIDMMTSEERWRVYSQFQSKGNTNKRSSFDAAEEEGILSATEMQNLCVQLEKLIQFEID